MNSGNKKDAIVAPTIHLQAARAPRLRIILPTKLTASFPKSLSLYQRFGLAHRSLPVGAEQVR